MESYRHPLSSATSTLPRIPGSSLLLYGLINFATIISNFTLDRCQIWISRAHGRISATGPYQVTSKFYKLNRTGMIIHEGDVLDYIIFVFLHFFVRARRPSGNGPFRPVVSPPLPSILDSIPPLPPSVWHFVIFTKLTVNCTKRTTTWHDRLLSSIRFTQMKSKTRTVENKILVRLFCTMYVTGLSSLRLLFPSLVILSLINRRQIPSDCLHFEQNKFDFKNTRRHIEIENIFVKLSN